MNLFGRIKKMVFGTEEKSEESEELNHDPHVMIPEHDDRKNFHRYKIGRLGSNCNAIDSRSEAGDIIRESEARSQGYSECGNCQRRREE